MALPSCELCGKTDPQRMVALMTLWFGPYVELEPAHGYFYLCPSCYGERVRPHVDEVQGKLAELHPLAAVYLRKQQEAESGGTKGADSPAADDSPDADTAGEAEPPARAG